MPWGNRYTSQGRYSPVSMIFHWVMAAMVLFQPGWGYWTSWMRPGGVAYEVHSAAGLPILLLRRGAATFTTSDGPPGRLLVPSENQAARDLPDAADQAFYKRRAEEELELAQSAVDPERCRPITNWRAATLT